MPTRLDSCLSSLTTQETVNLSNEFFLLHSREQLRSPVAFLPMWGRPRRSPPARGSTVRPHHGDRGRLHDYAPRIGKAGPFPAGPDRATARYWCRGESWPVARRPPPTPSTASRSLRCRPARSTTPARTGTGSLILLEAAQLVLAHLLRHCTRRLPSLFAGLVATARRTAMLFRGANCSCGSPRAICRPPPTSPRSPRRDVADERIL